MTGLELLRAIVDGGIEQPPISGTLGFRIVGAEANVARFSGEPARAQYNPMGQVHGGWACTLLDSAMGSAVMTTCDGETAYTTTQLSLYLVAAIDERTGPVTAEGRVVHRGRRIVTAEGKLSDARGRLLAHGSTSCLLLPRAPNRQAPVS